MPATPDPHAESLASLAGMFFSFPKSPLSIIYLISEPTIFYLKTAANKPKLHLPRSR